MDSLIPIFVDIDVACSSKKKALAVLAAKAAEALPVDEAALFTALNKREAGHNGHWWRCGAAERGRSGYLNRQNTVFAF